MYSVSMTILSHKTIYTRSPTGILHWTRLNIRDINNKQNTRYIIAMFESRWDALNIIHFWKNIIENRHNFIMVSTSIICDLFIWKKYLPTMLYKRMYSRSKKNHFFYTRCWSPVTRFCSLVAGTWTIYHMERIGWNFTSVTLAK